jgi:phage gpG-like protein
MELKFELQVDHLKRALAQARHEIAHPHDLLDSIGRSLLQVNRDRHQAGLAPDGSKWKPLSPLTLQEKRRGGPLNKTGSMLQSLDHQVHVDTLRLGFDGGRDAKLAAIHHGGTDPYVISPKKARALKFAGRVHHPGLPKRELLGFPESDQHLTEQVAADYLRVILNRVR